MIKTTGIKRNIIDKFYTKQSVVDTVMNEIVNTIDIDYDNDLIIEPSAGNGSFIKSIDNTCHNTLFYDLKPDDDRILTQDYLSLEIDDLNNMYRKIHVIGNPPFGIQSSLALKFIKKSVEYCDSISFILPKSFKKDSFKRKIDLYFHCLVEKDLEKNSFLIGEKEHNVQCVLQIWVRKDFKRIISEKMVPVGYKFVHKSEQHDISFRRVGWKAGDISIDTFDKNIHSHYFIKFDNFNTNLINNISNIIYKSKDYTIGARSISKQDIIKEYNKLI